MKNFSFLFFSFLFFSFLFFLSCSKSPIAPTEENPPINNNNISAALRSLSPGELHNEVCYYLISNYDKIDQKESSADRISVMISLVNEEYNVTTTLTDYLNSQGELKESSYAQSSTLTSSEVEYLTGIETKFTNDYNWESSSSSSQWTSFLDGEKSQISNNGLQNEEFVSDLLDIFKHSSMLWFDVSKGNDPAPGTSAIHCLFEGTMADIRYASENCTGLDDPTCAIGVAVASVAAYDHCEFGRSYIRNIYTELNGE